MLCLFLLIVVVVASRLPFIMHGLDEWDTANFALSIIHFDVLNHQPHPPGQLVYVCLMQLANALAGNALFTLSLTSAIGSSLLLLPYYFALRQIFRPAVALGASILTAFTFGFWITSLRMISDPISGVFVFGVVCALLAGLTNPRWFLFGMALCGVALGVKQTAVYFLAPFVIAINLVVVRRTGVRYPLLGSVLLAVTVGAWLSPTIRNCHGWTNYVAACRALQRENHDTESIIFHLSSEAARTQWQHNFLQPWGSTALAVLMLMLTAFGLVLCLRRGLRGALFALFGLTVAGYAYFFLYRFNKYYVYYVPIYDALAAAALFAIGAFLARRTQRPVLGSAVPWSAITLITAVNVAVTTPLLPTISHFRAPPQAAVEALRKMPGVAAVPVLVTDDRTTAHELTYFYQTKQIDLLNLQPDLHDAVAALNAGQKIYFLSPRALDTTSSEADAALLLGHYIWRPELYDALQGRPDLNQLSLYEVANPLPSTYAFRENDPHPILLCKGIWEDGWCGSDSRFLLPSGAGPNLAHLRITTREDFGYGYPYRLICQVANGLRTELTIEHAGTSDFVVSLPDQPGAHVAETRLLAPQTSRPSQRDTHLTDNRVLSVHLDEVECVTGSTPVAVHYDDGWYEPETDGKSRWRWTTGSATLSVLTNYPGTLVLEGSVLSFIGDNAVEVFVDDLRTQTMELPGKGWSTMEWRLPLKRGFQRVTLHSRNAGVQPPGDNRALALRVQDLQVRFER